MTGRIEIQLISPREGVISWTGTRRREFSGPLFAGANDENLKEFLLFVQKLFARKIHLIETRLSKLLIKSAL